jgi:hypothetical protein
VSEAARPGVDASRIERGVYFDAWFPGQHNYHPSFPPRRLRMIDHLEDYRATMLVWAALGGGNISLPYLEEEAWGEVPSRYRVYGFVNDAEFIRACGGRGIKVFGVVFEHAWEYPVELNEARDAVLAWNELRGEGVRAELGMREFWQHTYPELWPSRDRYFPEPVLDADGREVADILEECAQRDIDGNPCHALWIECSDREHWNYMMDRNNPVWRAYLKAIVRIQIDAGVHGIHFDESEVPITSLQYGGCFCDTCMRGFRSYLADLPPGERPTELEGEDLETFHYGTWLLARGYDFRSRREESPLFWDYMRFQRRNIVVYFRELATYARDYAASVGREVEISGNFFHLFDHYFAMEPDVDVIVTEMRNTTYRQPAWYRYAAGFGRGKPVVVVENPYGGVVPELVAMLREGRGHDRFRQSMYEAAALGANMSVPYGAWMGSEIEDAFYAPHELATEIQTFLADHEELLAPRTASEVGVVFSIESNYRALAAREVMSDNRTNEPPEGEIAFGRVCDALDDASQPYDVVFFPDGELRADDLTPGDLARYRTLVLPDVRFLTPVQGALLSGFVAAGGQAVIVGAFGDDVDARIVSAVVDAPTTRRVDDFSLDVLPDGPQVVIATLQGDTDVVVSVRDLGGRVAVHLLRYDHDDDRDEVPVLPALDLELRLPIEPTVAEPVDPHGVLEATLTAAGADGRCRLHLRDVPLYSIVVLS